MAVERLLSQFDLTLSQDVVKELQATGVAYSKEIWGQGTNRRAGCIVLEKNDQDVVRLKFSGKLSHSCTLLCDCKLLSLDHLF